MEWYLGAAACVAGVLDAVTTHLGLRDGRAEETNPLWRRLYPRLPLPVFVALLALGQFLISMGLYVLLGIEAQAGALAVASLVPLSNAIVLYRSRQGR